MALYSYDGPVMVFDTCVTSRWRAQTVAVSENKARCNLMYQFKKATNRLANTKIVLPGKLTRED